MTGTQTNDNIGRDFSVYYNDENEGLNTSLATARNILALSDYSHLPN